MATTQKTPLEGFAAVMIPYCASDPSWIYAEKKDATYPWFPNRLCFIGGNYGDPPSANDESPRDTLLRELREELSLDSSRDASYLSPRKPVQVLSEDNAMLKSVLEDMEDNLEPWMDCWLKVPASARKACDPERAEKKTPADTAGICSYWLCPLSDSVWETLLYLRAKFGRLSTESCDGPVSLDRILKEGLEWISGHDQAAQMFFAYTAGRGDCMDMPIIPEIVVDPIESRFETYDEYRKIYDFKKDPARARMP